MKIYFSHFNLAYPDPKNIHIDFEAETEFERGYLLNLVELAKNAKFKLEHIHISASQFGGIQLSCVGGDDIKSQEGAK